ncbi:MAG: VWA domain-containing protein [Desulfobacteraceae bacterium]
MTFARSEMLFFIWVVPLAFLICYQGMRRRRRILLNYSSKDELAVLTPRVSVKRRWTKYFMLIFVFFLITIALAGPQYGYKWQKVERKGVDLFIAIDCSKSMLADDIKPSRLERAKREVTDLLSMLEGDRAGLVAFAGTAFIQCPLTLDYQAFHIFMNALGPDYIPVGGTDINGAILEALKGFSEKDDTDKAIILITDGESTMTDAKEAVDEAKKRGVKVFCIGVGTEEGIPVPDTQGGFIKDDQGKIVMTRMDETALENISAQTSGTYVRSVAGDMDLDRIYTREIRRDMKQKTLTSGRQKVWEDRFQWFLLPAVLFMFGSIGLRSVETSRQERRKAR